MADTTLAATTPNLSRRRMMKTVSSASLAALATGTALAFPKAHAVTPVPTASPLDSEIASLFALWQPALDRVALAAELDNQRADDDPGDLRALPISVAAL